MVQFCEQQTILVGCDMTAESQYNRRLDESESGQMVLRKGKWTYFDKQCEIIQKNQWKSPNFQIQCFYNGTSEDFPKNMEN